MTTVITKTVEYYPKEIERKGEGENERKDGR